MDPNDARSTDDYPALSSAQVPPPEPFSTLAVVEFGAATHPGLVRPNNEDCYLVGRVERALETLATNLPPGAVPARFAEVSYGMLVADGLGGGAAGEVASRLAITTFINLVLHTPDWVMRSGEDEAERILGRITERYRQVGAALAERAGGDPTLAGMATTMTLAASHGTDLFVGHIGDSRAYLLRGSDLIRLTQDHTYSQGLADRGLIQQDEVETHQLRHILTRALGARGGEVHVDVSRGRLRDGDQLLLCSDGLTAMVPEDDIRGLLAAGTAAGACQALVAAALENGGLDNVTATLARYRFPPES
jgi:protein phosphatase